MTRWRVGKKLGRTLYRDDVCVGMVDTPELARAICDAMNERSESPGQDIEHAPTCRRRDQDPKTCVCNEWLTSADRPAPDGWEPGIVGARLDVEQARIRHLPGAAIELLKTAPGQRDADWQRRFDAACEPAAAEQGLVIDPESIRALEAEEAENAAEQGADDE